MSTPTSVPRVVVIGGGFGGLTAARALRHAPVDLLLIDRRNHHVFQPLLYQVATAGLSPGDIAAPIRWILRHQSNARVWMGDVVSIDTGGRHLRLADGTDVPYDYLLVAAGATHAYFGHDEWHQYAPGLKTLEDALDARRRVLLAFEQAERETDKAAQRRLLTFVVIGGGPTGVEMAGSLAEIARHTLAHDFRAIDPESARVILIEGGPNILGVYPEDLSAFARRALERLGVNVWTGSVVTSVTAGKVHVGGETIEAGTIIWAAGVSASPLGAKLGVPLDRAGRVLVNDDLTVPGHPEIFVIGDLAALKAADGRWLPGVAQVAIQQGRRAGANLARQLRGEPTQPFRYRNLGNLATIGRNKAVADLPGWKFKGYLAWLFWLFVHVMNLVGFRNRLSVLTQWAFSYITFQRSVRLITFDTADADADDAMPRS
ncbi:MAG: pyridine nucleotide-disulfide oxidoreductase [Acidobacteria bacterium SCN 69-37]|nr:MAG: pyridine nucleotide-disulfide oxidoreductase [Acidobacteria bacterium SCN 69-37]